MNVGKVLEWRPKTETPDNMTDVVALMNDHGEVYVGHHIYLSDDPKGEIVCDFTEPGFYTFDYETGQLFREEAVQIHLMAWAPLLEEIDYEEE